MKNAREEIDNDPSYKHELALDEDESLENNAEGGLTNKYDLQAIRNTQHDQGDHRQTSSDDDDKVRGLVPEMSTLQQKNMRQETNINTGGCQDL